jgi:lipoate-protein ligase A
MEPWRWLDTGAATGAANMALDAALLENPSAAGAPAVRVYAWSPPCISLGIHQRETAIDFGRCRERGVDVVRRPTGGRAVLHADEITYAVVIPRGSGWFRVPRHELYRTISEAVRLGLESLGLPARCARRRPPPPSPADPSASLDCFSAAARWEVLVDGRKIVGSAQRIRPEGLLQHGSILTGEGFRRLGEFVKRPDGAPAGAEAGAVSAGAFLGRPVPWNAAVAGLRSGFAAAFGVAFADARPSEAESAAAARLAPAFTVAGPRKECGS